MRGAVKALENKHVTELTPIKYIRIADSYLCTHIHYVNDVNVCCCRFYAT